MKGRVKWFNDQKGFGFIESDSGGDIFVHFTAILMTGHKTLQEGDQVEFEVEKSEKGPKASNVVLVGV